MLAVMHGGTDIRWTREVSATKNEQ